LGVSKVIARIVEASACMSKVKVWIFNKDY